MSESIRRILSLLPRALAALSLAAAGCPAPRPREVRVALPPAARAEPVWPPLVLDKLPGQVALPWSLPPGARTEAWRIDLLDAPRPDLSAWLETWQPRPGLLARPLLLDEGPGDPAVLRLDQPGACLVRTTAPGEARIALVLASSLRLALLLGDSDFEVLCVDAASGQPVQGAFVKVLYRTERLGRERVLAASGTTDAMGRWHSSLVRDRFARSVVATAIAGHDGHFAIATARRELDHSQTDYRLTLRARSPSFRPGQEADFTGVLQQRTAGGLAAMGNAPVRLVLLGPGEKPVADARVRTDAAGAFTSAFRLPKDAAAGRYVAVVTVEGEPRFEPRRVDLFRVEARQPAPFQLVASVSRPVAAPGDTLEISLAAWTAQGEPLRGARVRFLSWGYPVSLEGAPAWTRGAEPLDPRRIEVLPVQLPDEAALDKDGQLVARWQPAHAELFPEDLLCAVQAEVTAPGLGRAEETVQFLLLHEPPPVAVEIPRRFFRPSEPIELSFTTTIPPPRRADVQASCSLSYEDAEGQIHSYELACGSVAGFAENKLVVTATRPGRCTFAVTVGDAASEAVAWVVGGEGDLPWSGAEAPTLVSDRTWVRRGEAIPVVAAGPGRGAPLAVTLRSGRVVERPTPSLRTGARVLEVRAGQDYADPIEVTLMQIAGGEPSVGRATLGVEPGGRVLDVAADLLYVKHGESSERGYLVTTRDRLGQKVQSIVAIELVRPAFLGLPPTGLCRRTLDWYHGMATSVDGEMKVGYRSALLADAYALSIEALAPDGRAGTRLMPTQNPGFASDARPGTRRPPEDKLAALLRFGLDAPVAGWLAARLLARDPSLDARLPGLISREASDEAVLAALGLVSHHTGLLQTALERGGNVAQQALVMAEGFAPEVRPVLERVLGSDLDPRARGLAARALGRTATASLDSLTHALRADTDPEVRAAAASALASGGADAVSVLADAAMREDSTQVSVAIVGSLEHLGGRDAGIALLDLALSRKEEIAPAALRALAAIGYQEADGLLRHILRSGPPAARAEAAVLLARTGDPEAVRDVLAAARNQPTSAMVDALATVQSKSVQAAMGRWLTADEPAVRLAAAEHLAALKDERARPVLRAFLDPATPRELSDRAALALIEGRDDAAVPGLVALLEADRLSPATRRALIRAAGKLGWQQAGQAIVAILWRGLARPGQLDQPEDRELWVEALDAAAQVGPIWDAEIEKAAGPVPSGSLYAPALEALEAGGMEAFLRTLLASPLPADLRRKVVPPYTRLLGARAVPELVRLLESPCLQGEAERALAELGAVEALKAALRAPSAPTRAAAAAALGAAGDPRAAQAVELLLQDPDPWVRMEAAWALAALRRQPVVYVDHLGEPRQAAP